MNIEDKIEITNDKISFKKDEKEIWSLNNNGIEWGEGLRKFLAKKLLDNECEINCIETESNLYRPSVLKCELVAQYKPSLYTGLRNSRYELDSRHDWIDPLSYCYNDWNRTREAYDQFYRGLWNKDIFSLPEIVNVIFNNPATIVFWRDGSKTVVKCNDGEFDPEKGLAMAIAKKFLGNNDSKSNYYDVFKKWIPKEDKN